MSKEGMTLIEIIIAMALLAIISVGLISVMSTTIIGIHKFGNETVDVFTDQDSIEDDIVDSAATGTSGSITFQFDSGDTITINGETIEQNELEIFKPD